MTKPIVHKELEIHPLGGRHDTAGHRQGQRQHAKGLPKESREDSCMRRSLLMEARRLHQDLPSCPSEEEQMKGWYQCEGVR